MIPEHGTHASEIQRKAEMAVHEAKQSQIPVGFYSEDLSESAQSRELFSLEGGLRHALENNEYQLFLQPIVRLSDGVIVGAEALLRWAHPRFGLVSPARFVPLLEQSGEILPVGRWVLEEAVRRAAAWPPPPPPGGRRGRRPRRQLVLRLVRRVERRAHPRRR
jgi:sensor c-di-GMP phosphodiesterase-like protein